MLVLHTSIKGLESSTGLFAGLGDELDAQEEMARGEPEEEEAKPQDLEDLENRLHLGVKSANKSWTA